MPNSSLLHFLKYGSRRIGAAPHFKNVGGTSGWDQEVFEEEGR